MAFVRRKEPSSRHQKGFAGAGGVSGLASKGRSEASIYTFSGLARALPATRARKGDRGETQGATGEETQLAAMERAREGRALSLEDVVGFVLGYGALLSVAIIIAGVVMLAWSSATSSQLLLAAPMAASQLAPQPPAGLLSGLRAGDPAAVISLGLLVLIVTPVVRVASTVVYFLWKRDRVYLAITTFVLGVLLTGFVVGGTR